jgi:midasin (ATPase involved in ribosome maturation)
MNENMNPLSMMGEIKIQAGKLVYGRNGALKEALENGYILLLDELNLAPSEALQIVEDLSVYPKHITNPLNGEEIQISQDYCMIGTQNPPEDVSRKSLPSSLLQRSVIIETPDYSIK